MSDTTTLTGADGLAGLVAKWRKRVDDLDNKVTREMSDSEREWLQGKAEGLDEAADELEEALSSVADGERPFAYSQITPTSDPDVFYHHLYLLPPGHSVPEGATPLFPHPFAK